VPRVRSHVIIGSSQVNLLETHPWFNRFMSSKYLRRFSHFHERIAKKKFYSETLQKCRKKYAKVCNFWETRVL